MRNFVDELIKRIMLFCEELADLELFPFQRQVAYRIIESLILKDAEEITGLQSRQSGKSETIATVLAGCMVLLPKLALTYDILARFRKGVMVGIFAPVDDQ